MAIHNRLARRPRACKEAQACNSSHLSPISCCHSASLPRCPPPPCTRRHIWAGRACRARHRGHHCVPLRLLHRICRQLSNPFLPHRGLCRRGQGGGGGLLSTCASRVSSAAAVSCTKMCRRHPLQYHHAPSCPFPLRPAGGPDSGRLLRQQRSGPPGGHPGLRRALQLCGQQHCRRLRRLPDGVCGICSHLLRCGLFPAGGCRPLRCVGTVLAGLRCGAAGGAAGAYDACASAPCLTQARACSFRLLPQASSGWGCWERACRGAGSRQGQRSRQLCQAQKWSCRQQQMSPRLQPAHRKQAALTPLQQPCDDAADCETHPFVPLLISPNCCVANRVQQAG